MIRLFIALWAAVAAPATTQGKAERLSNATLGLSIDKPKSWVTLTAAANEANLGRAEFNSPEFQKQVQAYASVPLFAFTKFAEPYPDVNPSIKVNTRPAGQLSGRSGTEVLLTILPALSKVMPDYKLLTPPETVMLAGRTAGHAKVTYTLKSDGKKYPAASELWIVPRGNHLIIVGAGYRPNIASDQREISAIVGSLRVTG